MIGRRLGELRWKPYHTLWLLLFTAWAMCYLDRAITGPVVSWMIANGSPLLAGLEQPHAVGGLIGSMFFAGYMLTQFPAGYLGDHFGRRTMVVISTVWAGVTTTVSGLSRSLTVFTGTRVMTGLGEGAYYSNDRGLVVRNTPPEKVGTGMGVVFVGLAIGMTAATVSAPWLIDQVGGMLGEDAWAFPFLLFGPPTVLVGYVLHRYLPRGETESYRGAFPRLLLYSLLFLTVIMGFYQLSLVLHLDILWQTLFTLMASFLLIVVIYARLGTISALVLRDRSLQLMYLSAIPILFTLWFFGFWALLVVAESAGLGLSGAAVYAGLFGAANAIGYPLGGVMCDRFPGIRHRCGLYAGLCMGVCGTVLLLVPAILSTDLIVLGLLLFLIGALFSAMQTVHMTLTADLAPTEALGQAFGMWNLVAEVGALLSPVVCGWLRDAFGGWEPAILLTALLLAISAGLVSVIPRTVR
jgi:MFS family permease